MTYQINRMGWLPDPLDHRDRDLRDGAVRERLERVIPLTSRGVAPQPASAASPVGTIRADLRKWCSPIEDQKNIGSCTAQAVVGALEYFQRKTRGHHIDASRMFLYRATRRYLGWEGRGDTGAFVRSAIKALRVFGAAPEAYWPYDIGKWDDEPQAFHYSFAQNFRATEYFRVPEDVDTLKQVLDAGLPFVFGFTCFESLSEADQTGIVPYPNANDAVTGGHAVMAVGYTDSHVIFRNSWGTGWGDKGYGYLPWSYFDGKRPLATDCWVLVNVAWMSDDEGESYVKQRIAEVAALHGDVPGRESLTDDAGRASTESLTGLRHQARVRRPTPPPPPPKAQARRSDEKLRPRVQVARGVDPVHNLPVRVLHGGLRADPAAAVALAKSKAKASLYLKDVTLLDSFDWALFGGATNELYVTAICWDLSGAAPIVFPAEQVKGDGLKTYNLKEREVVTFVGDGLQIWPSQHVVGGLYVRLVIMESDDDLRSVGESIADVHKAVKDSDLTKALAALAAASGVSAPLLAAVGAAADVLTTVVASALRKNDDDLVALFDGTYGAERILNSRSDVYDQSGARITLNFNVNL